MVRQTADPTRTQFESYSQAFDYFNEVLFAGELPRCMLNFSRLSGACGYFVPKRWRRAEDRTHEISLNPDLLHLPAIEIMQTLVHEMCHLWQHELGKPSRAGYHNREWAAKMETVGLMPSSTGKPGGAKTGQHMADYVIHGGRFFDAFGYLPSECLLPWVSGREWTMTMVVPGAGQDVVDPALPDAGDDAPTEDPVKNRNKIKYTCRRCLANVWGKPELQIICGVCYERFEPCDLKA